MKKTIAFSVFCLTVLFLSQIYWLCQMYADFVEKKELEVKELLLSALDNEVGIRVADRPKNPDGLSYTIKYAEEMTPEERASLKGDTINLDEAIQKNLGRGISEIFAQAVQEQLAVNRPLRLSLVDSLYQIQLERNHIPPLFRLRLYDKDGNLSEQMEHEFQTNHTILLTGLLPIGIRENQFIQAEVVLPPYLLFKHLTSALIVSMMICLLVSFCLYYQLLALRKTQQLLEEREQAVYGAVHDLKKPLNRVFSILDFLQYNVAEVQNRDEPFIAFLKESKKQVRRLTETIESMLGDLRSGTQLTQPVWKETDLPTLIQSLYQETQARHPQKQVDFQLENPDAIGSLITDPVRIERCLQNLLENAYAYSDTSVSITVSIKQMDHGLQLSVTDTGWGMPPKALRHIGKAFYRYHHPGKPMYPGYGVGLNSVQRLINEVGGRFSVESQEGQGSSFHLYLPLKTGKHEENLFC